MENLEVMPTLKEWVLTHKDYLAGCIFYSAQPGAIINHHYGVDSSRNNIRLHLCLLEDTLCIFDIENERSTWKEGELFGFDDVGYWHGVKHLGINPRIILSIDIKKAYLKEYAINWPVRDFIINSEKNPPKILEW